MRHRASKPPCRCRRTRYAYLAGIVLLAVALTAASVKVRRLATENRALRSLVIYQASILDDVAKFFEQQQQHRKLPESRISTPER